MNVIPNNYSSYMSEYVLYSRDSDTLRKTPEVSVHREEPVKKLENKTVIQRDDPMVKFRLKLLKIYKKMTRTDIYYFHHQMKKYLPQLTDDVQEPTTIFSLLIKHGLIGPDNTQLLVESLFALKKHEQILILTRDQHSVSSKPTLPTFDRGNLSDEFILHFCTENIGPDQLWQLGVKGFKLPFIVIQRALYDSKTTLDATLAVFTQWRQQAPNASISELPAGAMPPYTKNGLAKALRDAQLNFALQKYFN